MDAVEVFALLAVVCSFEAATTPVRSARHAAGVIALAAICALAFVVAIGAGK